MVSAQFFVLKTIFGNINNVYTGIKCFIFNNKIWIDHSNIILQSVCRALRLLFLEPILAFNCWILAAIFFIVLQKTKFSGIFLFNSNIYKKSFNRHFKIKVLDQPWIFPELETFEKWISGLMLDLLFFLNLQIKKCLFSSCY